MAAEARLLFLTQSWGFRAASFSQIVRLARGPQWQPPVLSCNPESRRCLLGMDRTGPVPVAARTWQDGAAAVCSFSTRRRLCLILAGAGGRMVSNVQGAHGRLSNAPPRSWSGPLAGSRAGALAHLPSAGISCLLANPDAGHIPPAALAGRSPASATTMFCDYEARPRPDASSDGPRHAAKGASRPPAGQGGASMTWRLGGAILAGLGGRGRPCRSCATVAQNRASCIVRAVNSKSRPLPTMNPVENIWQSPPHVTTPASHARSHRNGAIGSRLMPQPVGLAGALRGSRT